MSETVPVEPTAQPEPSPPTSWSREPGNPLTLIGLAGRAGTGKDTVAAHLAERYNALLYALANPIRGALAGAFGLGDELVDRSLKEQPVPWLGQSPRRLMQSLGDWGRELCGADVWLRVAERVVAEAEHAPEYDYCPALIVMDLRYDNEAEWLRQRGGTVVHLRRPDAPPVAAHSSEAGVRFVAGDVTLDNAGTLDALRHAAEGVFEQLRLAATAVEADAELDCGTEVQA